MKLLKSLMVVPFVLASLALSLSAEPSSSKQRYYGKVTAINLAQKNLTVHNKRQKSDAVFLWNEETGITLNKERVSPNDLQVGQSLMVSYVMENNANLAKRISIRTPFKNKSDN